MTLRKPAASKIWSLVSSVTGLVRAFEIALRAVDGRRRQRVAHVFEADAARRQRAGVDLDMHGIGLLAEDARFGDAFHRRQLLREDRVGVVVDPVDRHRVGMDRIDQHRAVRRVGLAVGRRAGQVLRQQPGGGVYRLLHVLRGGVDVALEIELQGDHRRSDAARRGHLGEAGKRGKLLFERGRDRGRHGFRAGARDNSWSPRSSENRPSATPRPATNCRRRCRTPAPRASTARSRSAGG